MEKNLSGQPNMNSSLNSLTNYSQRPVCQTNTTSPIPTTTETSLTSIELVTRVIQDSDRTSKNDSRPEFNSQVTVDSNERMQNYLTSCRDVESSHLLSRSVVWKVPISSCNSPQTNKKNHFPSIVDEYPWPNVKMGERATLSPIGAHSNIGMYKETPSSPGRTVERISESPGRILNESHQSRIVDRYPKSPSEFSEGSPCPLARMVERYPRSPSGMSEGSPHLRTRMFDRYAQWPLGIPETSPQTPTNMFDQYPQSPSAMSQGSPQPPIRMVDRYPQSPAGVPEAPPQPPIGMVGRYSQSPSGVPESSPQPPIRLVDRYLQSPLAIPAASPQSTLEIPEISLEPQTRMVNRYLKSPSRIPLACTQTQPPTGVVNYYPHFSAAIPERSPPAFGLADTYSQLPVGVREGFSHSPNRTVDSYSQSPFEDGEGSSQLHTRVTDQSLQSPTQIPRGSPQPTTMMINSCLQPALLGVFERPGDSSYRQKLPDDIPLSFVGRTQCEMNLTYSENMQRTTLDQWNMSNSSELFSKSNCPMEKTNRDNTAIQVDPSSDEGCSSNEKLSFSSKNGADDLVDAGQILQKQLMAKQNQLQNVIQDQKRQLIEIQQQICLNAQAQYSLQEIADIETGKQFQRQAQILELERKQQEARQREIKSFVALKTNPTAVDTNSAKTIQQIMQLSYCGAAQPLGIEATGGQYASAVSTQSVITSSIASTSSQNILFKSSPNALKQLSSSTNPESSTQTINTSAEISTSATTTSTEDYFSKFTSSELGTFLSASSLSPSSSSVTSERSSLSGHTEKENNATQSSYDTLLVQQKQLLEMQEDQRRKLLLRQQEELLRIQQQQHGEMLLLQLEHSSLNSQEHTEQEPTTSSPQTQDHENRNLIFQSLGGLSGEPEQDTASTYELSEDDQCVINMLLNEGSDLEFWSEGIFKTTDYVP